MHPEEDDLFNEPPRPASNIGKLAHLMEFSRTGAIQQLFVLDSIAKMANRVAALPIEQLREQFGSGFISADAWQAAAKEFLETFPELKDKPHGPV